VLKAVTLKLMAQTLKKNPEMTVAGHCNTTVSRAMFPD